MKAPFARILLALPLRMIGLLFSESFVFLRSLFNVWFEEVAFVLDTHTKRSNKYATRYNQRGALKASVVRDIEKLPVRERDA